MLLDATDEGVYLPKFELATRDAFWEFTSFTVAAYACEEFVGRRLGALIVAPGINVQDEKYEELLQSAEEAHIARAIVSSQPPMHLNPGDTMFNPRMKLNKLQLLLSNWLLSKK